MPELIRRTQVLLLAMLAVMTLAAGSCASSSWQADFNQAYRRAIRPYGFNYAVWELKTFSSMLGQKLAGNTTRSGDDIQVVVRYFDNIARLEQLRGGSSADSTEREEQAGDLEILLADDQDRVEMVISEQISLALAEAGIFNPFVNNQLQITFPPVTFELEPSLNLLVISSRQKIERLRDTVIRPDITESQTAALEAGLEKYDVSALVVPLGGLGATYPSFVIRSSSLEYTLKVVAEEWLHQYLFFRPLGFQYVLELTGIKRDPDVATLNETVVGIAAEEIGTAVYERYYAAQFRKAASPPADPPDSDTFDFNAAMREIRVKTDVLLAEGKIDEAESYMEEQRRRLAGQGYYIRRLNQAYFAFYGSYAYHETSVDPLGSQVRQLRSSSLTLGDYLQKASSFTSRQALLDYLTTHS